MNIRDVGEVMGHLSTIMEEAKAMQATIERQRREKEKILDNVMKLRAENEKLTKDNAAITEASIIGSRFHRETKEESKRVESENDGLLNTVSRLRSENEKLTDVLRAAHDWLPSVLYDTAKGIIGESPNKPKTLKYIREAHPVGLTVKVMDWMTNIRFAGSQGYSAYETGDAWFLEDSSIASWIASVLGITRPEAYAASQASCAEAKARKQ